MNDPKNVDDVLRAAERAYREKMRRAMEVGRLRAELAQAETRLLEADDEAGLHLGTLALLAGRKP